MSTQQGEITELISFLRDSKAAVRRGAMDAVLGLTASDDGRALLRSIKIVDELRRLLGSALGEAACKALVNLCDDPLLSTQMMALIPTLMELLRDDECVFKREVVMLLTNLSQSPDSCEKILQTQDGAGSVMGLHFRLLIQWFLRPPMPEGDSFEYVASLLQNLTQLPAARRILLEPERGILPPLLRQLGSQSSTRRRGIAGVLRNLCIETNDAAVRYLLSPSVDVVTSLLLPLAGPDRYRAEEKEDMTPALYAGERKGGRETEPSTRRALVEAMVLLSVTRAGRDHLRGCRAYPVVRTFHEWLEGCEASTDAADASSALSAGASGGGGGFVGSRGAADPGDDDGPPLCEDDEATVAAINRLVQQLFREDEVAHTSEVTGVGKPIAAVEGAGTADTAAAAAPDFAAATDDDDSLIVPLDAPLLDTAQAAAAAAATRANNAAALRRPEPPRKVLYKIVPEVEARRRAVRATQGDSGSGVDDAMVTQLPDWTEDDPFLPPAFQLVQLQQPEAPTPLLSAPATSQPTGTNTESSAMC